MVASTLPPHNVITSISMTSYCMKTVSIPTSVRIYTVVLLNQDLTNELEGATIFEPDKKKCKQHYILHPYKGLPPCQTTAPDPSAMMHDTQLLYNSSHQCWDPSHLPHILCYSPSDLEPSSVHGKGHHVHNKKRGRNSAPPFNKRRQSM